MLLGLPVPMLLLSDRHQAGGEGDKRGRWGFAPRQQNTRRPATLWWIGGVRKGEFVCMCVFVRARHPAQKVRPTDRPDIADRVLANAIVRYAQAIDV